MKDVQNSHEEDYNWYPSEEYQGRSKRQVENNSRDGGCLFVLFIIALVWFGIYKLIMWLA